MELNNFIQTALLEITNGIDEANKQTKRFALCSEVRKGALEFGEFVEFDIAVTAESENLKTKGGKLSIQVASIGAGVDTKITDQTTHRLKFKVFIAEK